MTHPLAWKGLFTVWVLSVSLYSFVLPLCEQEPWKRHSVFLKLTRPRTTRKRVVAEVPVLMSLESCSPPVKRRRTVRKKGGAL